MEGKGITGMLAAAGVVLVGAAAFAVVGQDKTPPVITVGEERITYKEGDNHDTLLADVTAEDNRDKDLSDKVFIDRIIATKDGTEAVVIYGAMDSKNNVGTARRTVDYIPAEEGEETEESETPPKEEAEKPEEEKEDSEESEESEEKQPEEEQTEEEQEEDKGPLVPNGSSPAIRLKENAVTIKAGDSFNALSYVENIVDDRDSRDTLFKHIHIDGKYSTKEPGTYSLKYYATDSNGNASNIEIFTLTVQ